MSINKMYESLEPLIINDDMNNEELKKLVFSLYDILKKQNSLLYSFKNSYIRLENNLTYLEEEIDKYYKYQKLCNMILNKIYKNPFSAWWFLYKLKKRMLEFNKTF